MEPSKQQWIQLYEAAIAFKREQVWKWMENIHLFGVKHPDCRQVGYGCIMGHAGEMYGLAVYIGTSGLRTVVDMLTGQLKEDPFFAQHCLMLSFDDREDLLPQEKERIKELGFKFRGKQAWPTFRLHEPGYYPWPLQKGDEVRFLTTAIEQAIEVSLAYKGDPDTLVATPSSPILTRVYATQPNGSSSWSSEWLVPVEDDSEADLRHTQLVDELRLTKVKKAVQRQGGVWEVGHFYMPNPVMEGGRPYYPLIFMVVDQESGQIIEMELCEKSEIAGAALEKFISSVERYKLKPSELLATDGKLFEYLQPIITALNLKCTLVDRLPMLEEARQSLYARMGG